jgi:hypothetical protein
MSKKLMAVAAAAALALTGLVGVPANSAGSALTVTPTGSTAGAGATSTDAYTIPVPSQDVLRATNTVGRSVVDLAVATIENNATVTVTSTGAVKLLTEAQLAASTTTTATGTQSLSLTADSSGATTFHAYNTSTTAGSITVQEVKAGTVIAANTFWLEGSTDAANAYKLNAVVPTVAGLSSTVEFTATVVDMFGNAIENAHTITPDILGGDASVTGNMTWNATKKIYEHSFVNRSTAGAVALSIPLTVSADSVTAFGSKSVTSFTSINATDLQAAVTALTAQVAALTAQLAESRPKATSVTKKRYNTLVRAHRALGGTAKLKK